MTTKQTKQSKEQEDSLSYKDLRLGERAVDAYLDNKTPQEIYSQHPTFLNTHEVYAGLNTTDLMTAAVLAGMNTWLLGKMGTGKSLVMEDYAHFLFGGNLREHKDGRGYLAELGNNFDIREHFLEINKETGKDLALKQDVASACFYGLDEINHAHSKKQAEFYSFLKGVFDNGHRVSLGEKGYSVVFATGNDPRDDDARATFDSDGAFVNRFGLILDLNSPSFKPTAEDKNRIHKIKPPVSKYTHKAPTKNLLPEILRAHSGIVKNATDLGVEAEAVFQYLENSFGYCPGKKSNSSTEDTIEKDSILSGAWPNACFDCERESGNSIAGESPLCKLLNTSNNRAMQNARLYSSALSYVASLKQKSTKSSKTISPRDLAFLAFELCGAYQPNVLNEGILREDFHNRNHEMARQVIDGAKTEFKKFGDIYVCQLEAAKQGKTIKAIYSLGGGKLWFEKKLTENQESALKLQGSGLSQEELSSKAPEELGKLISNAKLKQEQMPSYKDNGELALSPLKEGLQIEIQDAKKIKANQRKAKKEE